MVNQHRRRSHHIHLLGVGVATLAVLAHLGVGATLLATLADFGGYALVIGLAVVGALKLLHLPAILGALGVLAMTIANRAKRANITTGRTLHRARFYDLLVALLTLGRGPAIREMTIDLARIEPGDAVLDVGCGTGDLTMRAGVQTGLEGQTVGIDASPEMIAEARRKAARTGITIDFQVAAIEALPFPDATFDVVLSSLMMHHLPDDLKDRGLAEIHRVLKSDGDLLIVDFRRPSTHRERLALPFLIHRHRSHDVGELPARLTAAGFVAVEAGKTGYSPLGFVRARAA